MNLANQPPTLDEWVHYCFTQGYSDFHGTSADGDAAINARKAHFFSLGKTALTQYMARLFEAPAFLADRYTDDQIAAAIWFIFGHGSGFIGEMRSPEVPHDLQLRCMQAITILYTDLFDRVCGRHGTDPDSNLYNSVGVDCAVYMIWDMDHLEGTVMFPEAGPHLVDPAIDILGNVLRRCRTGACRVSALHGIGHIYGFHNRRGDKAIAARLQSIVDAFTNRPDLPAWLRDYAAQAREGHVQ